MPTFTGTNEDDASFPGTDAPDTTFGLNGSDTLEGRHSADTLDGGGEDLLELASHALVPVEGVAAETFVDNAGRLAFDNWDKHQALHPDGRAVPEMPLPRAKSARQVPQALRERLVALAAEASPAVPTVA